MASQWITLQWVSSISLQLYSITVLLRFCTSEERLKIVYTSPQPNVYPRSGFFPSRIPDPRSNKKRERKQWISCINFFGSFSLFQKQVLTQFNLTSPTRRWPKISQNWKLFNFFHRYRTEKYLIQLTQNLSIFNPKIVTKLSEIWVGSRIRSHGSKKHRIPDPPHWYVYKFVNNYYVLSDTNLLLELYC